MTRKKLVTALSKLANTKQRLGCCCFMQNKIMRERNAT